MGRQHLVVEYVPVDAVRAHPRNPRVGDVEFILTSIERHDQYVPITVQRSTGFILRGNHTWQAVCRSGADTIAVVYVDVDDAEALEILLFDNRASDKGHYDNPTLAALLSELDDLEPTGWTRPELDDLLLALTPQSLDDLSRDLGEHDPAAVWPHVRLQVAPATKARFEVWWAGVPGDTDEAKLSGLLDRFDTGKPKRAKATA